MMKIVILVHAFVRNVGKTPMSLSSRSGFIFAKLLRSRWVGDLSQEELIKLGER
jgi:hypothetical protein